MNATMIFTITIGLAVLLAVFYFVPRLQPKEKSGRLARVRKAGLVGFVLLLVGLPLGIHEFFGFLFGWHRFLSSDVYRVVVLQQVFKSVKEMPSGVFWLWTVRQGFAFFAGFMLLRLFWLYSRGIIFSKKISPASVFKVIAFSSAISLIWKCRASSTTRPLV